MIYTENTKKALKLCFEAHKDQVDKSGMPYVFHPFHLAEQMKDEDTTIVALLHDLIEDTQYTLDDLKAMGFSKNIIEAIAAMTHGKDLSYMEYIENIKQDPIASIVKRADLLHNSDLSRLDKIDEQALKRVEKYKAALALLQNKGWKIKDEESVLGFPHSKERQKVCAAVMAKKLIVFKMLLLN